VPEFVTGAGELSVHNSQVDTEHVAVCTFGFEKATAPTVSDMNDLMVEFNGNFNTVIGSSWGTLKVAARWQETPLLVVAVESTSARNDYGGSANSAAPNVAVLVRKITGFAGRRNRGRFYVPGVEEDNIDGAGVLDTTSLGQWQSAATGWFNSMVTAGFDPVINHDDLSVLTTVTAYTVQAKCATQRRRLRD
jgi:hypothetical protein